MIEQIFYYYLLVCAGIATFQLIWAMYSDLRYGPDHKFGYAITSGITLMMIAVTSIPFINLAVLFWWIVAVGLQKRDEKIGQ